MMNPEQAEIERRKIVQRFKAVGLGVAAWVGASVLLTIALFNGVVLYGTGAYWTLLMGTYGLAGYVGAHNWPQR